MSPFLSNWLKEAQIIFRRIFQKDYRTIHLLISYLFIFQITSSVFEVVCGVEYEHLVLRLLNHSFLSPMFLHVFMSYYALSWVFSSLRFCDILILECHTTFINNLWILWGSTFFFLLHLWWGENGLAWCFAKYFYNHYEKCKISCFMKIDPCFFTPYLTIFMSSNWHCVITW